MPFFIMMKIISVDSWVRVIRVHLLSLNGLFHITNRGGRAGKGERGHSVGDCQRRPWTSLHKFPLLVRPVEPFLPRPPPPGSPRSPEAVRHKAVNYRIQAAVQAAQGDCDMVGQDVPHRLTWPLPADLKVEVNQQLSDVERREADSEDHQNGGQQPDGPSPPGPALLGHQAVAGWEKAGEAQSEAHHSQKRQEELQDGKVDEGGEDNAGGAGLQRCGLQSTSGFQGLSTNFCIYHVVLKQIWGRDSMPSANC